MKRKIFGILFALVLVLSLSLMTALPAFALATGNIADDDLSAQVIGMSKTVCVQKVTITNPLGAGNLDIDCFAVTNAGGTALDADVSRVAIWEDTNTSGTWESVGDTEIDFAADFTGAGTLGGNDDTFCVRVVKDTTEVVFVVVTTVAGPTDGRTFKTTIDGVDLAGSSNDAWDGGGSAATATSATTIDAVNPTAITTITVSPIYEGALTQTIRVTYNESMDPATTPTITMTTGTNWGAQTPVGWTTVTFTNDRYAATFTHDGTPEVIAEIADVANGSGATDVAGNADVGDDSPAFVVDTQKPTVAITSTASPGPTNTSPIPVTATFSENVTLFVVGDIVVGNGAAGNFVPVSGTIYTFDVTPAGQGLVTVDIGAGVAQDTAGNDNTVAPQFSITYDSVAPTVAITSTAPDPTNTSPIPITATFSEDVTGFVVGDITVGNGAAGNFVVVSAAIYTFDVTPAAQGAVTVDIAAAVAQDAAGNDNTVAPQFSITYTVIVYGGGGAPPDTTPPVVSDISASNITETGADISWRTNEKSTSQVEYWSSPSMFSPLDETMRYSHLVHLTDLTPGTAYHYKTMSKDSAGNLAVSDEDTFTTLGEAPAAVFSASDLSISPSEVNIGETVTISVLVANTGNASGDYEVTLKINGVREAEKSATVAAGASEEVTFTTAKDMAGSYSVDVNRLSGSFTVKEPAPAPAPPPPPPPAPPAPEAINWWLIGGIIAAVVVVGLLIFFLVVRRRA